jgi:hypothetical protein
MTGVPSEPVRHVVDFWRGLGLGLRRAFRMIVALALILAVVAIAVPLIIAAAAVAGVVIVTVGAVLAVLIVAAALMR